MNDFLLVLVVITALSFDFTNGFHDTGNAMATSIATKALSPRVAVGLSAVLNLVGAFLSLTVAATIASGLVDTGYPCRIGRETGMIELSGPPPSIVNVGGYRFRRDELAGQIGKAELAASIAALPDAMLSQRLAGNAIDR